VNYIVILHKKYRILDEKKVPVEAQSAADAMMIAGKDPENSEYYVYGVRQVEDE
jgi:hypothetical protein